MTRAIVFGAIATLTACAQTNSTPPTGSFAQPCRAEFTCDPGLFCHRDTCITLQREPYEAEPILGEVPLASLGGPIRIRNVPMSSGPRIFVTTAGLYVFDGQRDPDIFGLPALFGRDGRVLREASSELRGFVVFDGQHFYGSTRDETQVLNTDFVDEGEREPIPCRERYGVFRLETSDGRFPCVPEDYRPAVATYDVRTGEYHTLDTENDVYIIPGGTADLFVARNREPRETQYHIFRSTENGDLERVASRSFANGESRGDNRRWQFFARQVGTEIVTWLGERMDIGSPRCLEEGECFTQTAPPGERIFAATGAAENGYLALRDPAYIGWDEIIEDDELRHERYRRFVLERWNLRTGEVEETVVALPPMRHTALQWHEYNLLDDPWAGGAWIVGRTNDNDGADRAFELYWVPNE